MDSVVPDIKAKLNIVDVVGGYLRLTKAGTHWKANCPFHNEKTPSFMVNEERQIWHCFGCGRGGDVFSFVEEIEGVGFREALEMLAERAGVELPKYRRESVFGGGGVEEPDRTREILELSTKFYEKQLHEGMGKKSALPYLVKRGLTDESIRTFRLGYAPNGWRHLSDFLFSRGYRPDELEKAGLVIRKTQDSNPQSAIRNPQLYYDRFRDRIMFPVTDIVGRVIGYSARVAPGGDESQAKYINTPETAIYHKSRVLYGIYQAKAAMKEAGVTILVEGNMDVIAMHQAGERNTVAVSGTALTPEHLEILRRYGWGLALFFDMDEAGQAAAWKSALLAYEREMSVSIISLPAGKDAAEAAVEHPEALRNAISHPIPAARYFLTRLLEREEYDTPEGKRRVVEGYAPLLAAMKNKIERAHWIKELAFAIRVEEKMLSSVVESVRSQESAFQSQNEGKDSRQQDSKNRVFSRRSDAIRERIIGILLVKPEMKSVLLADESVAAFLRKHPLADAVFKGKDPLASVSSETEKEQMAKLIFETEEFLGGIPEDEDGRVNLEDILRNIAGDLQRELRKETLEVIIRKMEEARKRGDREAERKLAEEFSRFSSTS